MDYDDYDDYSDMDIDLINDLATASDSPVYTVGESVALSASPSDWQVIHEDIQSLHWSILCIYVIVFFAWVCKQWG